ncbi:MULTISPECIES: high-affinity branched-chain amino acid ABC transporter permease LivM [Aeromonas]|jgi:branched-chain amino acid transport system permease protein|uniref:High-affinity branched-chain amino acid ABC transporter permease LivM n=1 Tax=Aeromonas bestiarum TaxID=105751 RepID=A0AAP4JH86_9GAMM|nr:MULTISPECIES: high-affinity branched-chain amino acid ABC transporter permease LivM [Aeromonas]EKP0279993.1 high-affinity branched-chain amino acid ABC transporter permease LivM [Aeromonas bestiarum]KFN20046.1 leucine/isoleucine/valine transporter permease subunit [Aeromonas bestiarum]MCH7350032.1 high-affinity branched-chain amino acid ABC transporter permease LivM [Aeromonas sp. MR7]MDM5074224.1 high-affinity branched-chain amino acid ABC transporter permease LivM [Aeromonas bestiarum]MDM
MKRQFIHACIASLVLLVLSFWLLGFKLETDGTRLLVVSRLDVSLAWLVGGAALVFWFQMLRGQISRLFKGSISGFSIGFTKLVLPSPEEAPKLYNLTAVLVLLFAVSWPFMASRGAIDLATLTLIYIMLGLGLNVVVGLAGLLDLGYVGFYAVGAYSYALLNTYFGLSFWECLPIAGLTAATFGFLLGFPVLRLRGDYLAIVTLGFGEIIRILLNNMTSLTGGPNGISGIPKPTLGGLEFNRTVKDGGFGTFHDFFGIAYNANHKVIFLYLMALVLVVATLFVINRLLRMPLGRAWEALREDEIACKSLGLNPTIIKLTAFTIGACFAGFAGSFFASRQGFISPESFVFIESAIVLAIVVLGGMGSQIGVVLAAIVMTVLPELAREFNEYRMLMFGLLMVFMMIWRPQGLLPMTRPHLELQK